MAIIDIEKKITNIYIDAGATFNKDFIVKDDAGVAVDVTGFVARMQIRESKGSDVLLAEATSSAGEITVGTSDGVLAVGISASDSVDVSTIENAYYDIEVSDDAFVTVKRSHEGRAIVSRNVTR